MRKRIKKITLLLLVCVVAVIGVLAISKSDLFQVKTNKTSEASLIQEKLVELSEWTTLKYNYTNVIISRTEKSLSVLGLTDISYAKTVKLIEYSGYLKAGTDLSKIQMSYNESSKKISIRVPKSRILDNVVETEKTTVEDIKGNLFSDDPTQIIFDEINVHKKQLEEEKISEGFLEQADERVTYMLISFLKANGFNDVVIKFY